MKNIKTQPEASPTVNNNTHTPVGASSTYQRRPLVRPAGAREDRAEGLFACLARTPQPHRAAARIRCALSAAVY